MKGKGRKQKKKEVKGRFKVKICIFLDKNILDKTSPNQY